MTTVRAITAPVRAYSRALAALRSRQLSVGERQEEIAALGDAFTTIATTPTTAWPDLRRKAALLDHALALGRADAARRMTLSIARDLGLGRP